MISTFQPTLSLETVNSLLARLCTKSSLELFYEMLRIRMIEEEIANRYHEQKMRCPVHLSIGQEAIAVGVCKAVLSSDFLISTHRAHAHYLAKGGDLKAMIAEIHGKSTGCTFGRGGSMHLVDLSMGMVASTPIVGGSIPIGVGLAFASKMRSDPHITIIFFGEGATEEGVFAECLNFAVLKKLPILFVCENNLYSVNSPLSVRQPKERDRIGIARAHGLYAQSGFGNDVEEVYRMSQEAVDRIRQSLGPVYLEFDTYRFREHCGPNLDVNTGDRTEEECRHWEKKCPIKIQASKLEISEEEINRKKSIIREEIAEAFHFAENSPFPSYDLCDENLYA